MALAVVGCTADTAPDANPAGQGTTFTPAVSTTVPLATSNAPGQTGTTRSSEEVFCQQPPLAPGADDMVVTVYQICGIGEGSRSRMLAGLQPVERVTAQTDDPLRAAMEALLAGPTSDETAAGFGSWFSSATTSALLDVSISEDGGATIDLDGDTIAGMKNVSTTTGGDYFRGQLYGTVFTLDEVDLVGVSLDGDTSSFCAKMELIPDCTPITRSQWDEIYAQTTE